jgi:hypothetical protein
MPKAHEVASELRRLADALDVQPEVEIRTLWATFYCDTKEQFLNTAALLPKPLIKEYTDGKYGRLSLLNTKRWDVPMRLECSVERTLTCRIVKPAQEAVYECEPILSQIEEDSIA